MRRVLWSVVLSAVHGFALAGPAAEFKGDAARGSYLVNSFGCGDCHTPLKMGPGGPAPDRARGLSGHPQEAALPPPPAAQGPWVAAFAATNTAYAGPWGISYAANLTPDVKTGIGSWKADDFVKAMRTGKHLGVGRPILPPMPSRSLANMTDRDLRAIFAYLVAQPAVANLVPEPAAPAAPASASR